VKLLLDQNISRKLIPLLREEFPGSAHVAELDLAQSTDRQIWDYAGQNDFVIVSKDSDFRQFAFLFGPPPKAVWLDVGNVGSSTILQLIRHHRETIDHFSDNSEESFLLISRLT
jgi:predicted nuclease of predicted toxin-antitoxin system